MSQLADRHIELNAVLRGNTVGALTRIWRALPDHRDASLETWLQSVPALISAARRQQITITSTYLSRALDRPVDGADADAIMAGYRNGTPLETVYKRPFEVVWRSVGAGTPYPAAAEQGLARAAQTAAADVQMAMRDTLTSVGQAEDSIWGYQRVADGGACEFCLLLDGAQFKTDDPMPLHNFCVTGDTEVWSALTPASGSTHLSDFTSAQAATRRWYSGEVIVIHSSLGHKLTVTPNHPILTDSGWVLAGELQEGQNIISGTFPERISGRVPDEQQMPTRIEDYFSSRRSGALVTVPFASEQFHGEVGHSEVDVVAINGSLNARELAALVEPAEQTRLSRRSGLRMCLSCSGRLGEHGFSLRNAALSSVGGSHSRTSFGSSLVSGSNAVLFGGGSFDDSGLNDMGIDRSAAEANGGRDLVDRLASHVSGDNIFQLDRISFSGHVYNLVTRSGWYAGNGILTHNCGCGVEPVVYTRGRANRNNLAKFNSSLQKTPKGVDVNTHGELGPVIGNPDHAFTTA